MLRTDPGFAPDRVLGLQTFIWDRYTTPQQRATYVEQVLERLKSVPGVTAAGVTTALPFFESSLSSSLPFTIEGEARPTGRNRSRLPLRQCLRRCVRVPRLGAVLTSFDRAGAPWSS